MTPLAAFADRSLLGGRGVLWAAALLWWTLHGLVSAVNYHQMSALDGQPVTWEHALRTSLIGVSLWVPLTVAIFWFARRFPIERGRWRRGVLIHLLGGVAVALLRAAFIAIGNRWVGWYHRPPPFFSVLLSSFDYNLFLYWLFVGVAHALHLAQRDRLREAQLMRARLDALRAQLHPHFLFNTLNALAELVHRDADAAERVILDLGGILRQTLAAEQEGPLRDELALVRAYLDIEQVRFGDRLLVRWDIPADTQDLLVPRLLLLPLLDNAVRHAVAGRSTSGQVAISAAVEGGALRLVVRDDGPGPGATTGHWPASGAGVGLRNTRARLAELYGAAQRFSLRPGPEGGAEAEVVLPARRAVAA